MALPKPTKAAPEKVKGAIALALANINKRHGAGSISIGRSVISNVKSWPTDIATLDIALGCGGLPEGRIIEIFGGESAGKTTLCLTCIAAAQKQGKIAAFVDAEHALDVQWAKKLGVDIDTMLMAQPNSGEEALDIVQQLTDSGELGIIVIDSVAALVPQAELDGEVGDVFMGAQARMMGQAMRKLMGAASRTGAVIIFINQIREKIGQAYGSPETTPGGRALKFFASCRIKVSRDGEAMKKGDIKIGFPTRADIVKNKVGAPFVRAKFNIMFGIKGYAPGVDKMESIMSVACATPGVFEKTGNFLTFGGKKLNGASQWKEYIEANPEMFPAIREKTYSIALKAGASLVDMTEEEILSVHDDEQDTDPDAVVELDPGEEVDALEQTIAAQPVVPPVSTPERDDD